MSTLIPAANLPPSPPTTIQTEKNVKQQQKNTHTYGMASMKSELIAHHTPIATNVLTKKKKSARDMNGFGYIYAYKI